MSFGDNKPLNIRYIRASDEKRLDSLERGAFFEWKGDIFLKCFGPLHPDAPKGATCWNFTKGWFFNAPDDSDIVRELEAELIVVDKFARKEIE